MPAPQQKYILEGISGLIEVPELLKKVLAHNETLHKNNVEEISQDDGKSYKLESLYLLGPRSNSCFIKVPRFVLGDDYDPANCLLSNGWRGILVEVDTRWWFQKIVLKFVHGICTAFNFCYLW